MAVAFLYYKVFQYHSLRDVWHLIKAESTYQFYVYLCATFLLMFANWGLEAKKWQIIMQRTYSLSFLRSLKAVFTGNAFGIFTPNRLGSFVGRVLFLPEGYRAEGTLTTWVGNAAQLIATLFFGVVGAYFFYINPNYVWNFGSDFSFVKGTLLLFSIVVVMVLLLGYFFSKWVIKWFSQLAFVSKYLKQLEVMDTFSFGQLMYYLALSIMRYLVFVLQFYFVFHAFEITLSVFDTLVFVSVLYLIVAFMPTVLGKLGVRESVLIILLAHLPFTELNIIAASFSLWMINTVIAALMGLYFWLKLRPE